MTLTRPPTVISYYFPNDPNHHLPTAPVRIVAPVRLRDHLSDRHVTLTIEHDQQGQP